MVNYRYVLEVVTKEQKLEFDLFNVIKTVEQSRKMFVNLINLHYKCGFILT